MDNPTPTTKKFNSDVSVCLDVPRRDRFRVLLKRIGLSQNKLADAVGITKGTMSKIVNGFWFPTTDVAVRISKILDCDTIYLFGDSKAWKVYTEKIIYGEKKNE